MVRKRAALSVESLGCCSVGVISDVANVAEPTKPSDPPDVAKEAKGACVEAKSASVQVDIMVLGSDVREVVA
jgi:hypothetical protein